MTSVVLWQIKRFAFPFVGHQNQWTSTYLRCSLDECLATNEPTGVNSLPIHPRLWPRLHALLGLLVCPANSKLTTPACLPAWMAASPAPISYITHTHTNTHTHTQTQTHTRTRTLARTHTHLRTHAGTLGCTHTHSHDGVDATPSRAPLAPLTSHK